MAKHTKPDLYIPLEIGKYLADTLDLTTEQHGAYMLLIFAYWMRQGPLKDNDLALSSIAKLPLKKWKKETRAVVSQFFEIRDGFWHHTGADRRISHAVEVCETRRKTGKLGGEASAVARTKKEANASPNDNQMVDQTGNQNGKQNATNNKYQILNNNTEVVVGGEVSASKPERLCHALAIEPNFHKFQQAGLVITELEADGCDFDRHILAAAAKVVRGTANSPNIVRKIARDLLAEEKFKTANPEPFTDPPDWDAALRNFRDKQLWSSRWGPKPGEVGCRVPREILEAA